jgi:hypothetical protein
MQCGHLVDGHVWLPDDDLIPLAQLFDQLVEDNEQREGQRKPRHDPGE